MTYAVPPLVIGGVKLALAGHWTSAMAAGATAVVAAGASLLLMRTGDRRLPSARQLDRSDVARAAGIENAPYPSLPRGALAWGDGVLLRPTAVVHLLLLGAVGLLAVSIGGTRSVLEARPIEASGVALIVLASAMTAAMWIAWATVRAQEVGIDSVGVWRRRWPQRRLAWSDLIGIEPGRKNRNLDGEREDDIRLLGAAETRLGHRRRHLTLMPAVLGTASTDTELLLRYFAAHARPDPESPFHRWG